VREGERQDGEVSHRENKRCVTFREEPMRGFSDLFRPDCMTIADGFSGQGNLQQIPLVSSNQSKEKTNLDFLQLSDAHRYEFLDDELEWRKARDRASDPTLGQCLTIDKLIRGQEPTIPRLDTLHEILRKTRTHLWISENFIYRFDNEQKFS
jgi:hypothetical protein